MQQEKGKKMHTTCLFRLVERYHTRTNTYTPLHPHEYFRNDTYCKSNL